MASKRAEKWKRHHMEMSHGAWYLPYQYKIQEYEAQYEDVSGSLSYCPECNLVYDTIQTQVRQGSTKINTRRFYFYHDFPKLVKKNKYKTCYRCLGKPCEVVDRM
tara:strand:+ start:2685 stop:2999 length:315 start_codon:yes stop_codon:yes gene_type:complete